MVRIFSSMGISSGYRNLKSFFFSQASATPRASSMAPSPPFSHASLTYAPSAPAATAASLMMSISRSLSVRKRLTATTTGTPNLRQFLT